METAKLFYSGNSQAVRLPKGYRMREAEVYIKRMGNAIVLLPLDDPWRPLLNGVELFTDDYMASRLQGEVEARETAFE